MALSFQPFQPWSMLCVLLLAACSGAWLLRLALTAPEALGRRRVTRAAVTACTLLAALLLAVTAWHPVLVRAPDPASAHLVLVLDVSDSVLRADGGWPRLREALTEHMRAAVAAMPEARRAATTADLLTFRDGFSLADSALPLDRLPRAVSALEPHAFAAGDGSNLDAALAEAGRRIDQRGGAGAVVLVSDGNETDGDVVTRAQSLARRGIPVHVLPVGSGYPRLGITAADLPAQVHSGAETFLRGVLRHSGEGTVTARLTVGRNDGLPQEPDHFGAALAQSGAVTIDTWARLRQPLTFRGFGLQYADVELADAAGHNHRRRLFTQVVRPPQILALGGDFRWVEAVGVDDAEVTRARPEDLGVTVHARDFDAVVLGAVTANRLGPGVAADLVDAVRTSGVGLFLFNGDHAGLSEEAHSVLMTYKESVLGPILPVHPGPRPFTPDPPPRQIVILVDTSGSMGGDRLRKSKDICTYIINNLLRPKDTLDLLTFTTGVGHLVARRHMDPSGKAEALAQVENMKAGGGTDPKEALRLIAGRRMTDCGLIFISDGEFGNVSYRPDCRATVFAIGATSVPAGSPLRKLADPFPVGPDFNPARIRIPYFQPKPRKKFYEREGFTSLRIERFQRDIDTLPMPDLPLPGSAVSHIRAEADLVAVRPKLTDPTLAFMDVGRGRTGVFTSALGGPWLTEPAGRAALLRWLQEVMRFTARDRYAFAVSDRGETLDLEISLVPRRGVLPAVDGLSVTLERTDGGEVGVLMRPDPAVPGRFVGRAAVPRRKEAQRALLRLRELGPEALSRAQLVPFVVPPEGLVEGAPVAEAYSQGTNEPVLRAVASAGGGSYDPEARLPLMRRTTPRAVMESKPGPPLAAAFVFLLLAFALRRLDP